jgi:large subunit ribosomal protein L21
MGHYAIVEHGGKQYRVEPGDEVLVERLEPDLKAGDSLLFERVLLVNDDGGVRVGAPVVDGALVRAQVVAPERGNKIIVFKKKRRKQYKRTAGHRQSYYRVRIGEIEA